jgi:hypothetical protein
VLSQIQMLLQSNPNVDPYRFLTEVRPRLLPKTSVISRLID